MRYCTRRRLLFSIYQKSKSPMRKSCVQSIASFNTVRFFVIVSASVASLPAVYPHIRVNDNYPLTSSSRRRRIRAAFAMLCRSPLMSPKNLSGQFAIWPKLSNSTSDMVEPALTPGSQKYILIFSGDSRIWIVSPRSALCKRLKICSLWLSTISCKLRAASATWSIKSASAACALGCRCKFRLF